MAPNQAIVPEAADIAVVTGASGYLATELINQLLSKGYNVRGTVRSLTNQDKTEHLRKLNEALPGNLTLYEADLMKKGSFDGVMKGAQLVFHTASPVLLSADTDIKQQLILPAVEGTKTVLASVAKHKHTIRKVILTSSMAAIINPKSGPSSGGLYTEQDWHTDTSPDTTDVREGYMYSKVAAERTAWDMCNQENIKLITIQPSFILGPVISKRLDARSPEIFQTLLEANSAKEQMSFPRLCDVRDVARAHILAAELDHAHGRYIVFHTHTVSIKEITDVVAKRFPQYVIKDGKAAPKVNLVDNSKVQQELGITLTPWQESVIDMAVTLIQNGIAKPVLRLQ